MLLNRCRTKPFQAVCMFWPHCKVFKISAKSSESFKPFLTVNFSDKKFINTLNNQFLFSYHNTLHHPLLLRSFNLSVKRYYCVQNDSGSKVSLDSGSKLLKNHPSIIWPNLIQMFRNLFLTYFVIKPYYDSAFKIVPFVHASAKAASKVSELLSAGNFDALSELMDEKLVNDLKAVYKQLSTKDRLSLLFSPCDIIAKSLLIIGLIFEEPKIENVKQKIFIELTTVYHVIQGFDKKTENASLFTPNNSEIDPSETTIINFRFFKELSNVDDQYIINSLNYFKPLKADEKEKRKD